MNGKQIFGDSLSDIKSKLQDLSRFWNFDANVASKEIESLYSNARQSSLVWSASSGDKGNINFVENFLDLKLA